MHHGPRAFLRWGARQETPMLKCLGVLSDRCIGVLDHFCVAQAVNVALYAAPNRRTNGFKILQRLGMLGRPHLGQGVRLCGVVAVNVIPDHYIGMGCTLDQEGLVCGQA
ncbi:MAG: hypothetical protein ACRERD_22660, partial [Candidatus Binatia bacterium]